ncbi:MAG: hypothetical protein ABIQ06_05055 [Caldimonas sp.]
MSHATTMPGLLSVRAATLLRVLPPFAAISAVVGLLAAGALDRGLDGAGLFTRGAEAGAAQVWAAAPPAVQVPSRDSSVPDAHAALAGRELPAEEPAPTF